MKDEALKIVKILDRHLCAEPLIVDGERISEYVTGISEAAEEIIKEMDKACCEKCKYYSYQLDQCEYHLTEIYEPKILKCNDFTEMEGK